MKSRFTEQRYREEGIFLPLVAMMLVAIMAVIGLAVDGGHLHRSRLELQKAADAAVIAAAKRFALTPKPMRTANWKIRLIQDAHLVIRANLEANHGALNSNLNVQMTPADVDLDEETVRLNVTWDVGLYILNNFPGYSSRIPVKVASKAQVRKAMIGVLLDTSASMMCPSIGNDCSCLDQPPTYFCNDPKMRRIVEAVEDFAALFNENRDMFDITWFAVAARPDFFMNVVGGFSASDLHDHFDSIVNSQHNAGNTNHCDGMFRSYLSTLAATVYQHRANVARIIFTDGAPSAARFFFAQPTPAMDVNHDPNMPSDSVYDYDYYQWKKDYWFKPKDWIEGKPPDIRGVSDLAKYPIPANWSQGYAPDWVSNVDYDWEFPNGLHSKVACSIQDLSFPDPIAAYASCLYGFGFKLPDFSYTGQVYGTSVPFAEFRKQYYHCAIAMADFLRRNGSNLYAVSIGDPPPLSNDPYQDPLDDHTRKDCLLTRVTADPEPGNAMCKNVDFSPAEFSRNAILVPGQYQTGPQGNHANEGKYVYGLDATVVKQLLIDEIYPRIAKKTKTAVLVPYT